MKVSGQKYLDPYNFQHRGPDPHSYSNLGFDFSLGHCFADFSDVAVAIVAGLLGYRAGIRGSLAALDYPEIEDLVLKVEFFKEFEDFGTLWRGLIGKDCRWEATLVKTVL